MISLAQIGHKIIPRAPAANEEDTSYSSASKMVIGLSVSCSMWLFQVVGDSLNADTSASN